MAKVMGCHSYVTTLCYMEKAIVYGPPRLCYVRLGFARRLMVESYCPVTLGEANHEFYTLKEMNFSNMLREHRSRSFLTRVSK